jgi:hypothetical protein
MFGGLAFMVPGRHEETIMTKVVRCDCGWQVEADEDELVAAVQEHGRTVHNMETTLEQALAMARPA